VPLLEAKGHFVVAPDLPSHGDDPTPPANVTLESYADRICAVVSAQTEPVILVGHSAGGIAITQAAEYCANRIRALVYLCVFLPRNGESAAGLTQHDVESLLNGNIVPASEGAVSLRREVVQKALYGNCSAEDEAFASERLTPQPAAPLAVPVATSAERWGRIPRYYVECTRDRTITLRLQREMQKNSPCRRTFSIDTDHSPFFSAAEPLAEILLNVAKTRGVGGN
jgi:pimeloyl-ACP methyl ester carboxylesterase